MRDDLMKDAWIFPANFGPLLGANGNARITGPCGDTMEFWILADDGKVAQVSFTTDGCRHSILSGSAAARVAEGKTLEQAAAISQAAVLEAVGGLPEDSKHCALLASDALRAAAADCRSHDEKERMHGEACERAACPAAEQSDEPPDELEERRILKNRLSRIAHKIIVLSGKGGVGKSTVAVNLVVSLMLAGKRVGLAAAFFPWSLAAFGSCPSVFCSTTGTTQSSGADR
jgi:nitrogen fixation NifU-like protein